MTGLPLARDESAYLAGFLARVMSWDQRAAVRVQARRSVVGVYAPSPLDVLGFIALPLAGELAEPVDTTVSAGRLRDIVGDVARLPAVGEVTLPDPVTGAPSLAVLPPAGAWMPGERGTAGDVAGLVDSAVASFRAAVPPTGSINADLVAESTWDAPGWGGLPMRALHAARLLGFLAHPGARIETATISGWKRLVTPAGQVFVRNTSAPVRLSVVR